VSRPEIQLPAAEGAGFFDRHGGDHVGLFCIIIAAL
jgi:hypothetical protein